MGRLYLSCGDYLDNSFGMDAIVNSANKYMQNGSGICGAIYRASGIELLEYCNNHYKEYMKTGEVRITSGFNLDIEIIHVLAPKYYEEKDPINSLIDCYNNLLLEIKKKGYKKVLIPSLGTGVHGYKHEDVASYIINLLLEFCESNDIDIYFNNMYPLCKDIYLKCYFDIKKLDLKNDMSNLNILDIKKNLEENNLIELNVNNKYVNFVKDKELDELCLSEKLICLQYTISNFDVTKEQLLPLISKL